MIPYAPLPGPGFFRHLLIGVLFGTLFIAGFSVAIFLGIHPGIAIIPASLPVGVLLAWVAARTKKAEQTEVNQ